MHLLFQERPNENPATSSLETLIDALLQVARDERLELSCNDLVCGEGLLYHLHSGYDHWRRCQPTEGGAEVVDFLKF